MSCLLINFRFQPNDIKNIQKHYVPWRGPEEVSNPKISTSLLINKFKL